MIKVLMFNKLYHPYIGGVERHVYDLCEEIKKEVELKVLAANIKPKTEVEYKDNYQIVRAASLGKIFSSVHLGISVPLWWRRLKSDMVHFHFPSPIAEIFCLTLCPKKMPIVINYHSDIVGYKKAMVLYKPFLIKFLKRVNRIIVSSPAMLEHSPFLSKFKYKCTVIPYGIQIEKFRLTQQVEDGSEIIRKRFKNPIILFVGRLVGYKGICYLIHAMKKIDARLIIVGKGPEKRKLESLIGDIGIKKDKIFFAGEVNDEDLPAYYYASHLFVLPSISNNETFGISQLEAHACSRPVVSTGLPTGVPFANLDGITGIIVPPRSSDKLVEAINKLLKDDRLRQQLGRQARERVEAQFTSEIMARNILNVYKEVMG